jgi:16S rRNA processing protein RimM
MKKFIHFGNVSKIHGVLGNFVINANSFENPKSFVEHLFIKNGNDFTEFSVALKGILNEGNVIVFSEKHKTVEEARTLVGREIFIDRNALPPLENDEYYPCDIFGFTVLDENSQKVGTVVDVVDFGSGANVEVRNDKEKLEYYLIGDNKSINFENETISIILPQYV